MIPVGRRGEFHEGHEVFGSSEAQIAFVLKQAADGTPVGEVCREAGISDPIFTTGAKNTPA